MRIYLRIGNDTLDDAVGYTSKAGAAAAYRCVAEELAEYGQQIEASLHYAPCRNAIAEYPDFVLSLGPRGGLKIERA